MCIRDRSRSEAEAKTRSTYEQIRFAPVHGLTPLAPEMEPKKSSAGLILGLATSAVGGISDFQASGKPNIFERKSP